MKPTDLFTDLNDFQEYTDGLTADTTYAQLGPSITTVVNATVLPMVTAQVYIAHAQAIYHDISHMDLSCDFCFPLA